MKKQYIYILILALSIFSYNQIVDGFSIGEGKPINVGVIFLDGKYIESPYTITREGLILFVNGKKIERPSRHPGIKPITEETDANQLSEENRQKIFRNLEAARNIYETNLENGYGYLFFSQGGHIKLSPYTIAYDLPDIVKILTSNKTKAEKLTELKPYNWHLFFNLDPLIDNFVPSIQLISKMEQKAEELLRIDEYGSNEVSDNNGFVFYEGEYLEAPYVVKRKGLGVFINDKIIVRPLEIPNQSYSGDIDPELPSEITSESSIYDDIVRDYLMKKFTYLKNTKAELAIYETVIRNLPFVVEAETDPNNPDILNFTTTEGLYIPMSLVPLGDRGVKYDKNSVIKRVEDQRINIHNFLSSGGCYIKSSRDGIISLHGKEELIPVINILKTDKSASEKLLDFQKSNIRFSKNVFQEMINNFGVSSQLEIRLNE